MHLLSLRSPILCSSCTAHFFKLFRRAIDVLWDSFQTDEPSERRSEAPVERGVDDGVAGGVGPGQPHRRRDPPGTHARVLHHHDLNDDKNVLH